MPPLNTQSVIQYQQSSLNCLKTHHIAVVEVCATASWSEGKASPEGSGNHGKAATVHHVTPVTPSNNH